MKKALGLGLLCVLVGCSEPHDPTGGGKLAITKHENGKTASRGYVITNAVSDEPIKVGDWVYHYENGQKRSEGTCKNGKPEGVWTFTSKTGVAITASFAGGVEPDMKWTDNGWLVDGKEEGVWTYWHDNGQKKQEGTYKDGKEEGVWTIWWDTNGKKSIEGTYKDGKREGVWTSWYDNGKKLSEGTYKNGEEDGVSTYWDDKGNVMMTVTWKNGELVK